MALFLSLRLHHHSSTRRGSFQLHKPMQCCGVETWRGRNPLLSGVRNVRKQGTLPKHFPLPSPDLTPPHKPRTLLVNMQQYFIQNVWEL